MTTVILAQGPVTDRHKRLIKDIKDYAIKDEYVKSYDPNANDGQGDATFTADINEALKFKDIMEAWRFAMQVPAKKPWRADGKPNRPITAFTLEYIDVD